MLINFLSYINSFSSAHEIVGGVEDRFHIHNLFFNTLFLLAGISGIVLGINLIMKSKRNLAISYLSVFVLAISLAILELVLYWSEDWSYDPVVPLYRLFFFLWAPSIYLFLKVKLSSEVLKITAKELLGHYFAFFICFFGIWYLSFTANNDINSGNLIFLVFDFIANSVWFKVLFLLLYFVGMYKLYVKANSSLSRYHKKYIIALFVYYMHLIGLLLVRAVLNDEVWFVYIASYIFAILFSVFILFTALVIFFDERVLVKSFISKKEEESLEASDLESEKGMELETDATDYSHSVQKYKNSGLTESMVAQYKNDLLRLLEVDKVYLENDITLDKLAELLDTDRYSASQVINQEFDKSFYELLNDYRVQEVKILLNSSNHLNESVIQIAYSVGFSNRVSFNKAFKKRTGMTPTEYINGVKRGFNS